MLINLRNALMSGKRLPYDNEIEFLESTGQQYINTGVLPANNMSFDCAVMFTELTSGDHAVLDSRSSGGTCFQMAHTYANKWTVAIGGSYDANGSAVSTNTFYQLHGEASNGQTLTLFANGSQVATLTATGGISTIPIYVLARNLGARADAYSKARIYSLKIYVNGVLVRDYIPVRKGTVGYLYDRVSGKLFGNVGTGDFVLGQHVVPVEYIESHGTEWIDTGVIATNSHGFRVDVATAQKSGGINTRIFGVHEGNVRCGFALYGTGDPSGNDFFWGWNAATGFVADIPQRFVVSLNYKNDRAAIFNGTTNLSQLGTLGGITRSVYLLNANYGNAPFENQFVVGKFYGAEITVGSDVANHYLPVRVGQEGAMMDTLTRRIYRNAGTGAFGYGNDLPYPIPA